MFIKAIANLGVGGVLALCLSASVAGVVQAPRVPTGAEANVIAAFLEWVNDYVALHQQLERAL